MVIIIFFAVHYLLSIFCQTFFLHRYGAHRMFTMNKFWERFFHMLTYLSQGASYLNPRSYAMLHRQHHAYSDTRRDPHSPSNHGNVMSMMWETKKTYQAICLRTETPEARFQDGYPDWPLVDDIGLNRASSLCWIAFYVSFYAVFATAWWQWLLLPIQFLMGPFHGAVVNWCGHKYGYRNYKVSDDSRNTLFFDFLTLGELFQNNHHRFGNDPNFAKRWFEVDPTYVIIRMLALVHIVKLAPSKASDSLAEDSSLSGVAFADAKEA